MPGATARGMTRATAPNSFLRFPGFCPPRAAIRSCSAPSERASEDLVAHRVALGLFLDRQGFVDADAGHALPGLVFLEVDLAPELNDAGRHLSDGLRNARQRLRHIGNPDRQRQASAR